MQWHGGFGDDIGDDIGSRSGAAGISLEGMRSDSEWLVPKIGVFLWSAVWAEYII